MMDLNIVVNKIKSVDQNRVRIVPMVGQHGLDGNQQIEIFENNQWSSIMSGMRRNMAEDIIRQAQNRVILG